MTDAIHTPITLVLPSPPLLNSLYRTTGRHTYKVPKARAWEKRARAAYEGKFKVIPADYDVIVEAAWYRKKQIGDVDGPAKCLLDVLQGIAYVNDNQVQRLHMTRHDDPTNPRIEVTVTRGEKRVPRKSIRRKVA